LKFTKLSESTTAIRTQVRTSSIIVSGIEIKETF